jgi:hypothetical protein
LAENIKEGRNWETTQNQFDNIKIGIIENALGLDDCRFSLENEEPDYLKLNFSCLGGPQPTAVGGLHVTEFSVTFSHIFVDIPINYIKYIKLSVTTIKLFNKKSMLHISLHEVVCQCMN